MDEVKAEQLQASQRVSISAFASIPIDNCGKESEKIKEMRTKLAKDATKLRLELTAEHENTVHQLHQKRQSLESQMADIIKELTAAKDQLKKVHGENQRNESEIARLRAAQAEKEAKFQELHDSLKVKMSSHSKEQELQDKLWAVEVQLQAVTAERDNMETAHTELQEQHAKVGESLHDIQKAQQDLIAVGEKAQRDSDEAKTKQTAEHNKEMAFLKERLAAAEKAKDDRGRAAQSAIEALESDLKDRETKYNAEKDDLHQRIQEAETAVTRAQKGLEQYKRDAEDSIRKLREKQQKDSGELQRRLTEAEAAKNRLEASLQTQLRIINDSQESSQHAPSTAEDEAVRHALCSNLEPTVRVAHGPSRMPPPANRVPSQGGVSKQSQRGTLRESQPATGPLGDNQLPETFPEQRPRSHCMNFSQEVVHIYEDPNETQAALGAFESLTEHGVSFRPAAQASEIPETLQLMVNDPPRSQPITTFSQLNEGIHRAPTPLHDRSSSSLSELRSSPLQTQTPFEQRPTPDERRVLQELSSNPPLQRDIGRAASTQLGRAKTQSENPFFNFERPRSRSLANTASRMVDGSSSSIRVTCSASNADQRALGEVKHRSPLLDRPANVNGSKPAGQASTTGVKRGPDDSSPDYMLFERGPRGSNQMKVISTYGHLTARPHSGQTQHEDRPSSKRSRTEPDSGKDQASAEDYAEEVTVRSRQEQGSGTAVPHPAQRSSNSRFQTSTSKTPKSQAQQLSQTPSTMTTRLRSSQSSLPSSGSRIRRGASKSVSSSLSFLFIADRAHR